MIDTSESMGTNEKIRVLNDAVREAIPTMRAAAAAEAHVEMRVRVLAFDDGPRWEQRSPVPVDTFEWRDLDTGGRTRTGEALEEVARLVASDIPDRSLPPVIVLVSDGHATDDFEAGLAAVAATPWGARSVRIAIAIGSEADRDALSRFTSAEIGQVLEAGNPDALVEHIRWVSTQVVAEVSRSDVRSLTPEQPRPAVWGSIPDDAPSSSATVW